jgi:hypothetical protein
MRKIIRKVAAIGAGVAMLGSTLGGAVAADLSSTFGEAGTAYVVGLDAGQNDDGARDVLTNYFGGFVNVAGVGEENLLLERSSTKFNLGDTASDVWVTTITDNHLSTLLADGTYKDDNNDEFDFTQKITLTGTALTTAHFADSDYNSKEPSLGFKLSSGSHILNYTYDFTTNPDYDQSDLETTDLTFLGKTYFVSDFSNTSNKLTLLDSADSTVLVDGETLTVSGKSVTISFISSTEIKLNIDGEVTGSLAEGASYKLDDGAYVVIKDIMYDSKDTGISQVEFAIGSGKLEIDHGEYIELNDEDITDITGYIVNTSTKFDKFILTWAVDDEEFVTADANLVMPGFESIMISTDGLNFDSEEETKIEYDGDSSLEISAPIISGLANFNLIYGNGTAFTGIGKAADDMLVTSSTDEITWNQTRGDEWFVVTWDSTTEGESYLLSASITTSNEDNRTTIKDEVTGLNVCTDLIDGDTCTVGNSIITVSESYKSGSNKWVNFTVDSSSSYDELYTADGLKIILPVEVPLADTAPGKILINLTGTTDTTWDVEMYEEDRNSNVAQDSFNVTAAWTEAKVTISGIDTDSTEDGLEIGDTDVYEDYVHSELATKLLFDTSGTQDSVNVYYHGEEAKFDVYLSSLASTEFEPVLKTEAAAADYDKLILVGGPCVNTLTAEYLGLSANSCEADSGIALDKAIIQLVEKEGKTALIVAGYEQVDTLRAAQAVAAGGLTGETQLIV